METVTDSYRQYRPDFTIRQGDQRIYLEHFGITRDGRVPDWFSGADGQSATEKYNSDMAWKRALHQQHDTTLLETFSYEMSEGVLFDNLSVKLQKAAIVHKTKREAEIWARILRLGSGSSYTSSLINSQNNFLALICSSITKLGVAPSYSGASTTSPINVHPAFVGFEKSLLCQLPFN